jgi:hypothetical protein
MSQLQTWFGPVARQPFGFTTWRGACALPRWRELISFPQHPIKTSLRCQIDTLVRQRRHDLRRRQALIRGLVADLYDLLPFLGAQFVGRIRPLCLRPGIRFDTLLFGPALIGPQTDVLDFAGVCRRCPGRGRFLDQIDGLAAIWGTDHSASPSPQIAWAFFRRTSSAAVSAKAFSLILSSRSNSWMRRSSTLRASFKRWV